MSWLQVCELIGYYAIFVASFVLLVLCIINLQRHYTIGNDTSHQRGLIRHLLLLCILLQICVYIGYCVGNIYLAESCWTAWVPLSLFCLVHLCIRVAKSYMSIIGLNPSFGRSAKYCGYTFGILASVIDVSGTIIGFILDSDDILLITWTLYEIFTINTVIGVIILLNKVRNELNIRINSQSNMESNAKSVVKMTNSVNKISRIITCLILAIIFYSIAISISYLEYFKVYTPIVGSQMKKSLFTVFLETGMWVFLHSFILIYTWISLPEPKPENILLMQA